MAPRVLYHGAQAEKLLYNIKTGSLTANAQGELFFAEREWQNCLIHGADVDTGESYVAKFQVDIPDGAQLARVPTSGNPDTRILRVTPNAQVRAQVLELYVRRGRGGSFKTETIPPGSARVYLENKTASVKAPGAEVPPARAQIPDDPPPPLPEATMPKPPGSGGSARIYLKAAKAGLKAGLKSLLSAETLIGVGTTLFLAYADKVAAEDAIRRIEIKFTKEGFAKGVAAGVMGWTEDEVALNLMNRVTNFRVHDLGDEAGILTLPYILTLAETYENYYVGVGYYYS